MEVKNRAARIFVYTRKPDKDYTEELAGSIHFAYSEGEHDFHPLNFNYGILFATAYVDTQNVIHQKSLCLPYVFEEADGEYHIYAKRTDDTSKYVWWITNDFITFYNQGVQDIGDIPLRALSKLQYEMKQDTGSGSESPIIPGNSIEISEELLLKIKKYWLPVMNTQIKVPKQVMISSLEELKTVNAIAVYSDKSEEVKKVKWDTTPLLIVEIEQGKVYNIKGTVQQERFEFPLLSGYADPVILPWNGEYYFISTNDNTNDVGIYVRKAATKTALFHKKSDETDSDGYVESVILNVDKEKHFIQTFWAPEFHVIQDDLYILFAVGPEKWEPQCHMMKLRKDGEILNPDDWETPVRVMKKDGSFLAEDAITLDMTYFKAGTTSCLVWSNREHIGTKQDSGSMLYIATTDEKNPTKLTSDPVLLSRPLFGWENIQGTINNEGPYALVTKDKVYLTYSGGAANGYTYALGLLSIPIGADYLDADAWMKSPTPVLSYYSLPHVYGPGHNSFFKDYNGDVYILYHGEIELKPCGTRCSGMHRVKFRESGEPVFHVSAERDLNEALQDISVDIVFKPIL